MLHHGADDALGVITVAGVRDVHVLTVTVELLPVCCDGENIRVFARQPGWYRVSRGSDDDGKMMLCGGPLHHFHICLQTVIRQIFQIVGCSKEQVICSHIG